MARSLAVQGLGASHTPDFSYPQPLWHVRSPRTHLMNRHDMAHDSAITAPRTRAHAQRPNRPCPLLYGLARVCGRC